MGKDIAAGAYVAGASRVNHVLPGYGNPGPDGLCRCDAWPDPHAPEYTDGYIWCELALIGPRVSPHLAPTTANPTGAPIDTGV